MTFAFAHGAVEPGAASRRVDAARGLRRLAILAMALSAALLPAWAEAATGTTQYPVCVAEEGQLAAWVNAQRAAAGVAALTPSGDLVSVARSHAQTMAALNTLSHDGDLGSEVSNWSELAENVATGGSLAVIEQAFMASAQHRGNIVHPTYTQIGVGIVSARGNLWVSVIFRTPSETQSTAPPSTPSPPPASAPPSPPSTSPHPSPPSTSGVVTLTNGVTETTSATPSTTTTSTSTSTPTSVSSASDSGLRVPDGNRSHVLDASIARSPRDGRPRGVLPVALGGVIGLAGGGVAFGLRRTRRRGR